MHHPPILSKAVGWWPFTPESVANAERGEVKETLARVADRRTIKSLIHYDT